MWRGGVIVPRPGMKGPARCGDASYELLQLQPRCEATGSVLAQEIGHAAEQVASRHHILGRQPKILGDFGRIGLGGLVIAAGTTHPFQPSSPAGLTRPEMLVHVDRQRQFLHQFPANGCRDILSRFDATAWKAKQARGFDPFRATDDQESLLLMDDADDGMPTSIAVGGGWVLLHETA